MSFLGNLINKLNSKYAQENDDGLDSFRRELQNQIKQRVADIHARTAIQKAQSPNTWLWKEGDIVYSPRTGKTYEIVFIHVNKRGVPLYRYRNDHESGDFIADKAHLHLKKISEDQNSLLSEQVLIEGFRRDVPNENWLQDKINYSIKKGRDRFGAPYFNATTAWFDNDIRVPIQILRKLPGMRGEQKNVRTTDLTAIKKIMKDTGRLPLSNNQEYVPFIMVSYNGEAWVNEGNHRIMAAAELFDEGDERFDSLPIELKYFDGGERVESGPLYPNKLVQQGVAEGLSDVVKGIKRWEKVNNVINEKDVTKDRKKYFQWTDYDGYDLSIDDRVLIAESFFTNNGNLFESNDPQNSQYFLSLINMSSYLHKNKKYVLFMLTLINNNIITLQSPEVVKFLDKTPNGFKVLRNNGDITNFPDKRLTDKGLAIVTFLFDSVHDYDKFSTIMYLKYDFNLEVKEELFQNLNEMKNSTQQLDHNNRTVIGQPGVAEGSDDEYEYLPPGVGVKGYRPNTNKPRAKLVWKKSRNLGNISITHQKLLDLGFKYSEQYNSYGGTESMWDRLFNKESVKITKSKIWGQQEKDLSCGEPKTKTKEALLPKSAFAGTDKPHYHKLGPAAQAKGKQKGPVKRGQLVGGAEESVKTKQIPLGETTELIIDKLINRIIINERIQNNHRKFR